MEKTAIPCGYDCEVCDKPFTGILYGPSICPECENKQLKDQLARYREGLNLLMAVRAQAESVSNAPPGELVRGQAFDAKQVCKQVVEAIKAVDDSPKVTESVTEDK